MLPVSIIILTKNEEKNIERTLTPLIGLTDDILVIDSGSTDNTINIVKKLGAQLIETEWKGYAETKNYGHSLAKYNWILSLDADEEMGTELKESIQELFAKEIPENKAFKIRRKLVYGDTVLNYGSVSNEYRLRIFNRKNAHWNKNDVHEDIVFSSSAEIKKLEGYVLHHSYIDIEDHKKRVEQYAQLFAKQKKAEGKNIPFYKIYFSPIFNFIKNYIFRLGFLDGIKGWQHAIVEMKYTFRKYQLARQKGQ